MSSILRNLTVILNLLTEGTPIIAHINNTLQMVVHDPLQFLQVMHGVEAK